MTPFSRRYQIILWVIVGIVAILSCKPGLWGTPAIPVDCKEVVDPTPKDVEYVLEFTGDTFTSAGWERSYTVGDQRASVTWLKNAESALAYLEYLVYNCGYTQADLNTYFSERNFKEVIFRDYQNLQRQAQCANDDAGLTLHEFTAVWQEKDYRIRYWVKLDSDTRVLTLMLTFPEKAEPSLDRYAKDIFPALSSCRELKK